MGDVGGARSWEEQLDVGLAGCVPVVRVSFNLLWPRKKPALASLAGVCRGEIGIGIDRYSTSLKFRLVVKCQIFVCREGMILLFLNSRIKLYPHLELQCIILCFGFFLQGPNTIVICMVILLNIGLAILFVHFLT